MVTKVHTTYECKTEALCQEFLVVIAFRYCLLQMYKKIVVLVEMLLLK